MTLNSLLTNKWCGQLTAITWTLYSPLLNSTTRLTVPPGKAASAAALAFSAAVPVTIVPVPGRKLDGTRPITLDGVGSPRWNGMTFAVAALAVPDALLLLEPELAIATPPIASATATAPAATNLVSLRESM